MGSGSVPVRRSLLSDTESFVNPKPLQARGVPIIFGSMTPGGIERAAQVADGLHPIAFSRDPLSGMVLSFRDAARAAGRDAAQLATVDPRARQLTAFRPRHSLTVTRPISAARRTRSPPTSRSSST